MQRKLIADGSNLWENPEDQFVIRFKDLDETKKKHFALRIKETDKHKTIREKDSSFVDEILTLLEEVNPVIYAEGAHRRFHNIHWQKTAIFALSGYSYKLLSKTIYRFLCIEKKKEIDDYRKAFYSSVMGVKTQEGTSPYSNIEAVLETIPFPPVHESFPPPEEISLEAVSYTRERAEQTAARATSQNITN